MVQVGPHEYDPPRLGFIARLLGRSRHYCRACYLPQWQHPVGGWVRARPMGDTTPAVPGKQSSRRAL